MADDKNPEHRIEPTLDLNPKTDRTPDKGSFDDMMQSFGETFGDARPEEMSAEIPLDTNVEDELRAEVADLKDQVLRSLAEVENVRRRLERDKADATKYAVANFAKAVLPVADNLERALAAAPVEARAKDDNLKNLCVGLELTQNELRAAYERVGVKPIDAMGRKLDPNLHQAMFEIEDPSVPAGTILQIMQPGYTIHDRLLRPAMVGVSKGGPRDGTTPAPSAAAANENPGPSSNASGAYDRTDHPSEHNGGKAVDREL